MKKVGILGGSFNPIHEGHLSMAQQARVQLGFNEVWLMPTQQSPLKFSINMASFKDRVAMCKLAAAPYPWLKVSEEEQEINSRRTLPLISHLKEKYPDYQFHWLMGADAFQQMDQWFEWEKLISEIPIIIFARPDQAKNVLECTAAKKFKNLRYLHQDGFLNPKGWTLLGNVPTPTSSTAIRNALCEGLSAPGLNKDVAEYISRNTLYQTAAWYVPNITEDTLGMLYVEKGFCRTIHNPQNIYTNAKSSLEAKEEIDTLMRVSGRIAGDVIAFRPEREALHELVVALSTRFRLADYHELDRITKQIYEKRVLPKIISNCVWPKIEEDAEQQAEGYLTQPDTAPDFIQEVINDSKFDSGASVEIKQRLILNLILQKSVRSEVERIVADVLSNEKNRDNFGLKPLYAADISVCDKMMVVGGPAVGKGRVIKQLENQVVGGFANYCKLNPDYYKEILLDPATVRRPYMPYYGTLTHDESFIVNDKVFLRWREMADKGYAPNIMMDIARPHPWVMNIINVGDQPIRINLVVCKIEEALQRNMARGLKTRRFINTEKLLDLHKSLPDMFQSAIEDYDPAVTVINTNDDEPTIIGSRNPSEQLEIYNDEAWREFLSLSALNKNSRSCRELFVFQSDDVCTDIARCLVRNVRGGK